MDKTSFIPCSSVFDAPADGQPLMWDPADEYTCMVSVSANNLTVIYDADFASDPAFTVAGAGNNVTIKDGVVGQAAVDTPVLLTAAAATAAGNSTTVLISAAANPVKPVLDFAYPTGIPKCANFEFNFAAVTGDGGRLWKNVSVTVDTKGTSAKGLNVSELNTFLAQSVLDAVNGFDISVTPALMPVGTYSFNATFRNFLNQQGSMLIKTTRFNTDVYPFVTFDNTFTNNIASVDSDQVLGITPSEMAGCPPLPTFSYMWFKAAGPNLDLTGQETASSLYFEPHKLRGGSKYTIGVQLTDDAGNSNNFTYSFSTANGKISGDVGSGTVGRNQFWTLDATIYDSGVNPADVKASDYTCAWSCKDSKDKPCKDLKGGALKISDTSCTGVNMTGMLRASGQPYTFSAEVSVKVGNNKGMTGEGLVTVVAGAPPQVSIVASAGPKPSGDNPSYALTAVVDPTTIQTDPALLNYTWTLLDSCGGDSYFSFDLRNRTRVASANRGLGQSSLIFASDGLVPGKSYCAQVEVQDPAADASAMPGTGLYTFKVLKRPESGTCVLDKKTTPVELSTPVTINCRGWNTDPDAKPITYAFMASTNASDPDSFTLLGTPGTDSNFQASMPAGIYFIKPLIFDRAGSFAADQKPIRVEVTASALVRRASAATVMDKLNKCKTDYGKTKDAKALTSCLGTFTASDVYLKDVNASALAADMLFTMLQDVILTKDRSVSAAGIASRVASLPDSAATSFAFKSVVFNTLVMMVNNTYNVGKASGACATDDTLTKWMQVLQASASGELNQAARKSLFQLDDIVAQCVGLNVRCSQPCKKVAADGSLYTQNVCHPQLAAAATNVGGFAVNIALPGATANKSVCVRASTLQATVPVPGTSGQMMSMTLMNSTSNQEIKVEGKYDFSFTVNATIKAALDAGTMKPSCSYIKYSGANGDLTGSSLAADGVTTATYVKNSGVVRCSSIHLTDFVLKLEAVAATTTAGSGTTTANAAATNAATTTGAAGSGATTTAGSGAATTTAGAGGSGATTTTVAAGSGTTTTSSVSTPTEAPKSAPAVGAGGLASIVLSSLFGLASLAALLL